MEFSDVIKNRYSCKKFSNEDNFLGITQFVFYIWLRINYIYVVNI